MATAAAALQQAPVTFQSRTPVSARVSSVKPVKFSFSGGLRLPKLSIKLTGKPRRTGGGGASGAKMADSAAGSYAAALLEVAVANGTLEQTVKDVELVDQLFSEDSLLSYFVSPIVSLEDKRALLDDITASGKLQVHVCNFINILVESKRIDMIKEIVKEFELAYNRLTNTELAVVSSVVKLEEQHMAQIAKQVQKLTGAKNVRLKTVIDESLVAGFTIRYGNSGSKLIDMSVKKQLEEIAAELEIGAATTEDDNKKKKMSDTHSNGDSKSSVKLPNIKFTKLFINGEFVDSISGKTFETIDPRTEEVIANIAEGDKDDIDLAVKAARAAFDHGPWPRMSGSERGRIMMKFVNLVEENIEELALLDAIDAGKVLTYGKARDIPFGASVLRYYAGAADKIHGKTLKMSNQLQGYTLHEPIGVVGHIIPWNFPAGMFFFKVSPAMAAGCTMVVKPAEQSPLSALYCANLAKLAGVPDGVINVVTGFGPTAGAAISSHMDIDCVSFTGSSEVGRLVMQAAAMSNLKSVSLELGGKSPLIVFDDVDVDSVVNLALLGGFANKGEFCVCSSRIFVQEGIYDEFVTKFVKNAKNITVGDPFDPSTRQGPQVDRAQYEKVLSYIEHGKRQGATLVTGGKPSGDKGLYIEPTIFTNVTDDMLIATDEIFGPVISLFKFKTIEEAIERANSTRYGLAAGIATNNLNIANTVSRSLRAGIVWINCYLAFDADGPYGGYKLSGFGREFGMEGLYKYLQVKSVVTPLHNSPWL